MKPELQSQSDCRKISIKLCKTLEKIIEKVVPTNKEEEEIDKRIRLEFEEIKGKLLSYQEKYGFERIELHGSAAKGTWLKDDIDLDIFIVFREIKTKAYLEKMIREIAPKLNMPYTFRHSEHPYLRVEHPEFYPADIVPAFDLGGKKFASATDRTIYHTKLVKEKLRPEQRNEVRLLKKFLKTIGAYGAEIKTQGFSGYSIELLIMIFGSMINVLSFIANKDKFILSLDKGEIEDENLYKTFQTNYILIDPVDSKRNTLAALSEETYNIVKFASKLFLYKPSTKFFETPEIHDKIQVRDRNIYDIKLQFAPGTPPDIKWGIMKKLAKQITKALQREKIGIIYTKPIEDENKENHIIIETDKDSTPKYIKITGPPANSNPKNIYNFIKKHSKAEAGPWIEKNRIVALEKKPEKEVTLLIKEEIEKLTTKYEKTIEKTEVKKITKTENPEIIKHINRKENWLLP